LKIIENRKNEHIQILIADEPPIYGNGLRALLENEPDFNVVGIASNQTATLRMSQERKPDVLLLNVRMTANDGMDVLDQLQTLNISVRPLLLAPSVSGPQLMRALLLGARGVVLKKSSAQTLFDGIRGVMIGQYWIGAEVGTSMMEGLRQYHRSGGGTTKKGAFGLTPRELDIVSTVVGGYSNAEIAQKYKLSEQTVKHHLSSIFDKVGVFNRLELALFAVNHRLVENDAG
jgi:DNA-binding NarL/FixJ family response regulator